MSRRRKGVFTLLLGASLPASSPPPPPPPVGLAIVHDTRWGTSTDANGWITFGLPGGCKRTYWDSVSGIDANNGLTPATAVLTFSRMWAVFQSGWIAGDQIMLAGGSAGGNYNDPDDTTSLTTHCGTGPSVMTVIQSYDRADPTGATTKFGELVGSAMPVFSLLSANSTFLTVVNIEGAGYVAVSGVEVKDISGASAALSLGLGGNENRHPGFVYQNCRFNGVTLGHDPATLSDTAATNTQNAGLISKCSQWNSGGVAWASSDSLRIQDFVSAHCGWDITATRDDPIVMGGPAVFTHAFYLHANCTNLSLNRIVAVDVTDGFGSRAGAVSVNQIVSIDNPFGLSVGGFSNPILTEAPNGVPWQLDDAVVMGSDKQIQVDNPGGVGMQWLNTVPGSYTRNVALFDFDAYGSLDPSENRYAASTRVDAGQVPQSMLCDKWSGYHFAITGETDIGTDMANSHLSWSNSVLDVLPTGSNGTVTTTTTRSTPPTGYKTRSQIYTTMGYATKADLINAMLWRPDLPWAQSICGIGLPVMGLTPTYLTVAPPAVVTGAPVIYKTALADLTASSLAFTRGTPKAIVLSGVAAASYLSCSDFPAGFSNTPFRKTISGTATAGSNQITGASDVSGLLPGMLIEQKGNAFTSVSLFPALTVVTSISGTTITVSNNATANSSGENVFVSAGGRLVSYDGSGTGAATPTIHVVETPKDAGMSVHTTVLVLNIASGVVGTTWAANADWTLSNGSLTALRSGASTFWSTEHASVAKTNGTVIFTYDAAGSATQNYIGFDTGGETNGLGSSGTGQSISWRQDGAIFYAGGTTTWDAGGAATTAAWALTDALKIVKAGAVFTFYLNGTLQGSIDTSNARFGVGVPMAGNCYPSLNSNNATGFQVTADFSAF